MPGSAHQRLTAWRAAHDLVIAIYQATDLWPASERFGLTAQMRRAAWSSAACIVEGAAKRGPREFARFLDVANGSLAELGYGIQLAIDLGYLPVHDAERLQALHATAAQRTFGLYRYQRKKVASVPRASQPL